MDDVTKKLEALDKRIKELESKLKSNLLMFGRSYSQAGDSNSDFLIKTRGLVKIQYGSKFIDLIKDGKINCDAKFIYKGSVGSKDGIYVDGENVFLKIGDSKPINLIGEIGTTYVSFLAEQETTSNLKYIAQKNIGLITNTLDDIDITSGIVYVESEGKLYLINNENIEEFKAEFPNPFPELFIINKSDSKIGSILILGSGKENSLAFNGLYIYKDNDSIIESLKPLTIAVSEKNILKLELSLSAFLNDVISNMFKSPGGEFKLYYNNGSTLEVDNLIVRNSSQNLAFIGELWYSVSNRIKKIKLLNEENTLFKINLSLENNFKENDEIITIILTLTVYNENTENEYSIIELTTILFMVTSIYNDYIEVISNDSVDIFEELVDNIIYTINPKNPIRIKDNSLDIIEYPDSVKTRIGDLSELGYSGSGIYTDNFVLKDLGNINEIILNILSNIDNINSRIEDLTNRIEDLENV